MKKERRAQNASYLMLDDQIRDTYIQIIKKEKWIPTQAEVAKRCNISEKTVTRHLDQISLTNLVHPYRVLGNEVLTALFKEAAGGNIAAVKLYFMLMFDWSERETMVHEGDVKTTIVVKYEEAGKGE